MPRQVDPEVLAGFIEEAKGYLSPIRQGIADCATLTQAAELLAEAHRHVHTIKGAASMLGLAGLSHMAFQLEDALEAIATGALPVTPATPGQLAAIVSLLECYLLDLARHELDEGSLLTQATRLFATLRGQADAPADTMKAGDTGAAPPPPEMSAPSPMASELPAAGNAEREEASTQLPSSQDEVSPELLEVFALEAEDHLRTISGLLPVLERQPQSKELLQDVRRAAHTLKGAAAMVGFRAITQLAHRMEDLLDRLYEGQQEVSHDAIRLLFASTDALEDMAAGKTISAALSDLYARYAAILNREPEAEGTAAQQTPVEETADEPAESEDAPAERTLAAAASAGDGGSHSGQFVRVPIERLDDLVKLVSELVITRTGFEQRMGDFLRIVGELQPSTERLRRSSYKLETQYEASLLTGSHAGDVSRPTFANGLTPKNGHSNGNGHSDGAALSLTTPRAAHGFDDLEFDRYTEFHLISRELAETTSDIQTVGGELAHLIGDFDSYLNRQARLASEIEEKLRRLRMVPLATLASRLHRTVRNVATQQHKQVELVLEGERTELDKTVLEQMADPLLHLLRNSVDHGIEPPELRLARGKTPRGTIRLRAGQEGSQIVLQVGDDGAGIDPEVVRATAVSRGVLSVADAANRSPKELLALLFLPGFSTAREISEVSGRGVGLDIVKAHVHKLKGTVDVDSQPGQGTTFTIRLPMTLAIARALLVKAHQETFAIPLDAVLQLLRVERNQLEQVGTEPVLRVNGQVYPVIYLGKLLGLKQPADESVAQPPVVLLNAGGKHVALVVDRLLGGREIVIKTLGSHLRRVHGITGATLMGDGSVVLILNPTDLVAQETEARPTVRPAGPTKAAHTGAALTVLVVDDSPSVRRVVASLLRNAGWEPVTAKDGLEALEILHRSGRLPDLVLLDIEMPRMDGYELLSTLRAQDAYRALPVVMVTSRTGEKHRRKAMDLGASGYVVKPYQDEALLSVIRQLTQGARQVQPA